MDKNQGVYNSKALVNWYTQLRQLLPVEQKIFEMFRSVLQNGKVLDIGIGGGRTTSYLADKCKEYTGIDYSENLVRAVKAQYPSLDCRVMDARNLSAFEANSFDFVNFSFNGIDYVDLDGREQIIKEISRILKPGGIFFFSTHNKDHNSFDRLPWMDRTQGLWTNFKTFVKLLPFLSRKKRNRKKEIFRNDYAIINDSAHQFSLMTFYTRPAFLREQLKSSGFTDVCFYLRSGDPKEDSGLEDWIFVSASKILA